MDAKKGAIIILVLIGVLFVVILATSGSQGDGGKINTNSFSSIRDRFVTKRSVRPDELGGHDFVIRQGDEFVATVPETKDVRVRTMRLEMTHGNAVEIELNLKDYGVRVALKLKTDSRKTPSLQVFEKGAVLQARCVVPDPILRTCTLQLTD
jgi:hypothetical protein